MSSNNESNKCNTIKNSTTTKRKTVDKLEELASKATDYDLYAIDKVITKKQCAMLAALEENMGIVTTSAKRAGINPKTHYDWIKNNAHYAAAYNLIDNNTLDIVETAFYKNIIEGNVPAQIFYLKTKGRKRGYVERVETEAKIDLVGFDFVEVTGEDNE